MSSEPEPEPEAVEAPEVAAEEATPAEPAKAISYDRPDEDTQKSLISGIMEEIETYKRQVSELNSKIEAKNGVKTGHREGQTGVRGELKEIHSKRQAAIGQKKAARASMQAIERVQLPPRKDGPKMSVEEIDDKIRRLEHTHKTESLSIKAERELIKEVKELTRSKSGVATHFKSITALKEKKKVSEDKRTEFFDVMKGLDKEIDAMRVVEDGIRARLDKMREKESTESGNIPELIKERNAIKALVNDCYDRKRKLSTDFKVDLDKWYANERLVRVQGADERKARYEAKKAEDAAYYANIEKEKKEEEAALGPIDPFEHEKKLCDNVSRYITAFLATAKAEVKVAKEIDHGGMKIMGGKKNSAEDNMWENLSNSKKGKKKGKKKQAKGRVLGGAGKAKYVPEVLKLKHSMIAALHELDVEVPLMAANVAACIASLAEKKEAYDVMASKGQKSAKARTGAKPRVLNLKITAKGDSAVQLNITYL